MKLYPIQSVHFLNALDVPGVSNYKSDFFDVALIATIDTRLTFIDEKISEELVIQNSRFSSTDLLHERILFSLMNHFPHLNAL